MKMMLRTAFAALALVATTAAFADDHRDHDRHGDNRGHDRGHDRGDWHHDNGPRGHRGPPPRYYGGYHHGPEYYQRPPPPRYYGHWERGHRYGGRNVVVYDYGSYRLRPRRVATTGSARTTTFCLSPWRPASSSTSPRAKPRLPETHS
jgi:hypothetical protein